MGTKPRGHAGTQPQEHRQTQQSRSDHNFCKAKPGVTRKRAHYVAQNERFVQMHQVLQESVATPRRDSSVNSKNWHSANTECTMLSKVKILWVQSEANQATFPKEINLCAQSAWAKIEGDNTVRRQKDRHFLSEHSVHAECMALLKSDRSRTQLDPCELVL